MHFFISGWCSNRLYTLQSTVCLFSNPVRREILEILIVFYFDGPLSHYTVLLYSTQEYSIAAEFIIKYAIEGFDTLKNSTLVGKKLYSTCMNHRISDVYLLILCVLDKSLTVIKWMQLQFFPNHDSEKSIICQ